MKEEQFKPRNKEEWKIQEEWLQKHIKLGGTVVVEEKTNAVIRIEYDNPIYHYYKHQYDEQKILLSALGFAVDDLSLSVSGEIPEVPPEVKTIKARIYKHLVV